MRSDANRAENRAAVICIRANNTQFPIANFLRTLTYMPRIIRNTIFRLTTDDVANGTCNFYRVNASDVIRILIEK